MDRRLSRRFLCAELVEVRWKDKAGRLRRSVANLEDISRCGACIQMEGSVPIDTAVVVGCDGGDLPGTVRYSMYRDWSYFLGIEFAEGAQWSRRRYRPQHMLDPRELMIRAARRSRMASRPLLGYDAQRRPSQSS
jgi:hypothetical protein